MDLISIGIILLVFIILIVLIMIFKSDDKKLEQVDPWCVDKKCTKSCAEWNDLQTNKNTYCSTDYGSEFKAVEVDRAGCPMGHGKASCA